MRRVFAATALGAAFVAAVSFTPEPVRADHCSIAVTIESENHQRVSISSDFYNATIDFPASDSSRQAPIIGHDKCPDDKELLFEVHDCTDALIYAFKAGPKGTYEDDDEVPLYIVGGPLGGKPENAACS